MKLDEQQLYELKQCELAIFRAFLQVCDTLNLRYYLIGGTLLGAVRHQGFIPWDDDIDVGMPREDYDRFVREGQALLPGHYFIQTYHTDPDWPEIFAKIRDSRTTFIESSLKERKINHGVYIDIFPLDYYPENAADARKVEIMHKLFRAKINQAFTLPRENKEPAVRKIGKKALSVLVSLKYPSLESVLSAREELLKSVPKSALIKNYSGAWGKKEISPNEWFSTGIMLSFEGLAVRGPRNYHEYLTRVYGDYMQLPPEGDRRGHHYCELLDFEKGYTYYVK